MGRPFSRFHSRAVLSQDALARIGTLGDIAMERTQLVCPFKTWICCQVVVFHVIIESSHDPETSVLPSAVQARQNIFCVCPLRFVS